MTRWIWIGLVMIGLAACSGVDKQTDYDPGVDFSTYQTYEWVTDELMVQAAGGSRSTGERPRPAAHSRRHRQIAGQQRLSKGTVRGFRRRFHRRPARPTTGLALGPLWLLLSPLWRLRPLSRTSGYGGADHGHLLYARDARHRHVRCADQTADMAWPRHQDRSRQRRSAASYPGNCRQRPR